ncbi:ribose-phosphate pyrophosphokinase [Flammeovirgaceae bacterium 311]|nr:ribose-phosphate pyrophosphokinase [Flammeovirgaceae bacterium 311]
MINKPFKIFATSSAQQLGATIASELSQELGNFHSETFSDGEKFVSFGESIRGRLVFIVSQINMPYENLFELFLAIDAARRSSAEQVIAVLPYLPHSRQERKGNVRTAIASRLVADLMQQSGADRVMTLDLHTGSIEGFFKIPVDHLFMSQIYIRHIQELGLPNLCLCSPDFGGLKRIKLYKQALNCDMAVIHKERLKPNQVSHMEIIGDVADKHVVLIDDLIDTAGTICTAADLLMEQGAASVRAYCTHGIFSGAALQRIEASALERVYVSDSVNYVQQDGKIELVSCGHLIAQAIKRLLENGSLMEIANHGI